MRIRGLRRIAAKTCSYRLPGRRWKPQNQRLVNAPVDLVPAEMGEVGVETLWRNRFYALTFRKPGRIVQVTAAPGEAVAREEASTRT